MIQWSVWSSNKRKELLRWIMMTRVRIFSVVWGLCGQTKEWVWSVVAVTLTGRTGGAVPVAGCRHKLHVHWSGEVPRCISITNAFSCVPSQKVRRVGRAGFVHSMTAHRRAEAQLHTFLTSALHGGEWSTSRTGRFTPQERTSEPVWAFYRRHNSLVYVGNRTPRPFSP